VPSSALIAEATRRSSVVWVAATDEPPALVWHLWHDGAMYLVGGGPEQRLPVQPGDAARVVVRSKAAQAGVVAEWAATVYAVVPGSDLWDEVVPLLAAERLNAEAGRAERWAAECLVLRLTPST
jgi:hypothetical protein